MSSRLSSSFAAERALTTLAKTLDQCGVLDSVRMAIGREKPQPVRLPGFSVLSRTAGQRVIDWLLPEPTGTVEDFLFLYEAFVNSPLGMFREPWKKASEVYRGRGCRKPIFKNDGPTSSHWLTPAVLLLCVGQHFNDEQSIEWTETRNGTVYSLHVADLFLSVSPDKVYSNTARAYLRPPREAQDDHCADLKLPSCTAEHPLVWAVQKHEEDLDMAAVGWLLNTVYRAHLAGRLSNQQIYSALDAASRPAKVQTGARDEALRIATYILRGEEDRIVYPLFNVLVPDVMGYREFQTYIANPQDVDRVVSAATRERWLHKIPLIEAGDARAE